MICLLGWFIEGAITICTIRKKKFKSIDDFPHLKKHIESVLHQGNDVMQLYASSDVAVFSRTLGESLIDEKLFADRMLSPREISKKLKLRSSLDADTVKKFKGKERYK